MDKTLNILFLLKRPGIGGVQTFIKTLSRHLEQNGYNAYIYFRHPDFLEDLYTFKGFKYFNLTTNKVVLLSINYLSKFLSSLGFNYKEYLIKKHLIKVLKKNNINLVHLNTDSFDFILPEINKINIPIVLTLHGIYKALYFEEKRNNPKIFQREKHRIKSLNKYCNKITYFSDDNLLPFKLILGNDIESQNKFLKLNNPAIKYKEQKNKEKNPVLRFALFGRGFKEKGWAEAFACYENLRKEGFKLELHFFGKGQYLEEYYSKNNVPKGFYYHGVSQNVPEDLKKIDIGLVPSYHEEMPYIIIEYLASGIPIIASKTGEISKMLETESGELAGWLLDLENEKPSILQLSEFMKGILEGNYDLKKYSKRAELAFSKFDIEEVGGEYLKLYKSII